MTRRCAGERGSAVIWLLLIVPVLFGFAGLVLDGGRVITARQNASNVAEQAARSAGDELNRSLFRGTVAQVGAVNLGAAQAAACGYAAVAGPTSSCSATLTDSGQVQVDVTITTRTVLLSALGISQITVAGTGRARAGVGVTQEEVPQ